MRIYPPYASVGISATPRVSLAVEALYRGLEPVVPPPVSEGITIDGKASVPANAMQIDFMAGSFNRDQASKDFDPDPSIAFAHVNSVLRRLRTVAQAYHMEELHPRRCPWAIEYLTDQGQELLKEEGLVRRVWSLRGSVRVWGINREVWTAATQLPGDYSPSKWDELLLDAHRVLPSLGPAIVLAASAVETAADQITDALALQSTIPDFLWTWITDRGDFRKDPSLEERLDVVLRAVASTSLKKEQALWQGFQELKKARNNYVHEGQLTLDGTPLSEERVEKLLDTGKQIVSWLEKLAPLSMRRPVFAGKVLTVGTFEFGQ